MDWLLLFSHSVVSDFCDPMDCSSQASLSFTIFQTLLKFMSIELMMPSNYLILCHPLLLLPSIFPSIGSFLMSCLFASGDQSFSFSISPSNEYSGLISFKINWIDLAVQRTLQHCNSKASILQCSAFFMVKFSHPYMIPGKTIALIIWTFVGKVMSLLYNALCRFIIVFLPKYIQGIKWWTSGGAGQLLFLVSLFLITCLESLFWPL